MSEHPERDARMVDVTGKATSVREAEASAIVEMSEETRGKVMQRTLDKGDALEVARIAGIMAAKRTSDLIPLCHPLAIGGVDVTIEPDERGVIVRTIVRTTDRTGVEMEALTAATIAGLTIYDMIKSVERGARLTDVKLVRKSGGRSGDYQAS